MIILMKTHYDISRDLSSICVEESILWYLFYVHMAEKITEKLSTCIHNNLVHVH